MNWVVPLTMLLTGAVYGQFPMVTDYSVSSRPCLKHSHVEVDT